jgi:hypothetical protein
MKVNRDHVTMYGEERVLLERHEALFGTVRLFGETPPVAFLDPITSKRMIKRALRNNCPFNEKDVEAELDAM